MRIGLLTPGLLVTLLGCGGGGSVTPTPPVSKPGIVKSGRNIQFHSLSFDGKVAYGGDNTRQAFVWTDRQPPKYIPLRTLSDKNGVAFGSSADGSKTWLIVDSRVYTYSSGSFTLSPLVANATYGPFPNQDGTELLVNSSSSGYWDGSFFEPLKVPERYYFEVVAASDDLGISYGYANRKLFRYLRGGGYKYFQSLDETDIGIEQATADGDAFVGWIQAPLGRTSAIKWQDGSYEVIQPGTATQNAFAVGTDGNGETIVGTLGQTSWIWTRATGVVDLLTYLANHPSIAELRTYRRLTVQAISRDAKMILVQAESNSGFQLIKIYL